MRTLEYIDSVGTIPASTLFTLDLQVTEALPYNATGVPVLVRGRSLKAEMTGSEDAAVRGDSKSSHEEGSAIAALRVNSNSPDRSRTPFNANGVPVLVRVRSLEAEDAAPQQARKPLIRAAARARISTPTAIVTIHRLQTLCVFLSTHSTSLSSGVSDESSTSAMDPLPAATPSHQLF